MFEKYVRRPRILARLRKSPFASELEALVDVLERRGHRPSTINSYLLAAARLADCIEQRRVPLDGLTADGLLQLARQLATRLPCGCPRRGVDRDLIGIAPHVFAVLCDHGRCRPPPAVPLPKTPLDDLLTRFDQHLHQERGLADSTRERYLRDLQPVLAAKFGNDVVELSAITVQDVQAWIVARAAATTPRTARKLRDSLVCLLRFLILHGEPVEHLLRAIPMVQVARLPAVPRGLSEQQLAQLIHSIDRSKPIGLRALAIVECAAFLGLRAGEIAALRLSDIDWREGVLHLPKTKSRRAQALPLTRDVGRALVAYLKRGRPKTSCDRIFVRHYFPVGEPLTSKDVTGTVHRAFVCAGLDLPSTGAHVLRHTTAGRLVRVGAGMKEIADVLRHREIDTTQIYAKVDWPRLQEIALPWPAPETS